MAKFIKKPIPVEACQLPQAGPSALKWCDFLKWADANGFHDYSDAEDGGIDIKTLEGVLHATPLSWVCKGQHGDFWTVKPDIFAATYEPFDEAAS